jgi:Lon protease-like protein
MELPLFPLHTVLCPGIALPLHIFEDRYRALTQHCLDTSSPFGIVLIREGREVGPGTVSFSAVGTLAEIREAGTYPDGRFDLLVVGTGRFAIDEVATEREPYLVGDVTVLEDEIGDSEEAERLAAIAVRRFAHYLALLQPRDGETAPDIDIRVEVETERPTPTDAQAGSDDDELPAARVVLPDDPTTLSHLLSGIIQVEAVRRQELLEAETTVERLRDLLVLIGRETFLLSRRLRTFVPDVPSLASRRS